MRRGAGALVLLGALGGAPACAPDESSIGSVRTEPALLAEYFDARSFQRPSRVYRDPNIDFAGWQLNELIQARGHAARSVSIRWSGQIRFDHAETYTIGFELQGRVRIWIDDAAVIDDWVDSDVLRETRGTIAAPEPGWRDLRVEWDQLDGPMTARLRYRSPSQPDTIVPPIALRHPDL